MSTIAKVKESLRQDIGRGIVRLSEDLLDDLDIGPGDAILIKGKKEAVALVWGSADSDDDDEDIIRMDGTLRYNAGVGIDDDVTIEPIELNNAKSILLSPQQQIDFNDDFIDYVHEKIANMPLIVGNSVVIHVMGRQLPLVVTKIDPSPSRVVTDTKITISKKPIEGSAVSNKGVRYEDIGGLKNEIDAVREMVEIPMKNPEVFKHLGINPPKGVLLYGPPGTGKTLLARAVASETNAHFITLNGPEIMSKFYGQSEENLRNVFKEAQENAPSIIFIDEIDAIAPNRDEVQGEVERRVVAQLLTLMDGLEARGDVIVVAATNRPDSIDPALRRPGRFDRELNISVPNRDARKEILLIHTRNMPVELDYTKFNVTLAIKNIINSLNKGSKEGKSKEAQVKKEQLKAFENLLNKVEKSDSESVKDLVVQNEYKDTIEYELKTMMMDEVSDKAIGFTGADLEALSKEAALRPLKSLMPEIKKAEGKLSKDIMSRLKVTRSDFEYALNLVEPSAMREVAVEIPNVKYSDIGGLDNVKDTIKEAVEWPLKYAKLFEQAGVGPAKGILLYGPPGTGKTMLAKAVANESRANFILIKGPELLSKWVGESEKGIRKVFQKARQVAPSIIFFDEIDALVPSRGSSMDSGVSDKLVAQLLTEIDGVTKLKDVLVMASTNRPDLLDKALIRPGRFDKLIYINVPDLESRKQIFSVHTRGMLLDKSVHFEELAKKTEGYSGADIEAVCRETGMIAIRDAVAKGEEQIHPITMKQFNAVLDKIKASYDNDEKEKWEDLEKKMSSIVR